MTKGMNGAVLFEGLLTGLVKASSVQFMLSVQVHACALNRHGYGVV